MTVVTRNLEGPNSKGIGGSSSWPSWGCYQPLGPSFQGSRDSPQGRLHIHPDSSRGSQLGTRQDKDRHPDMLGSSDTLHSLVGKLVHPAVDSHSRKDHTDRRDSSLRSHKGSHKDRNHSRHTDKDNRHNLGSPGSFHRPQDSKGQNPKQWSHPHFLRTALEHFPCRPWLHADCKATHEASS